PKGPEDAQMNKSRNKPNEKAEKTSRALRSSPHRNSSSAPPPEIRRNRLRPSQMMDVRGLRLGDTVHVSFVVIKADTPWHYSEDGVDLVVKDPNGNQVHDSRAKVSDKFEFIVQKRGVHRFCFTNKSPYHETVDFDVHVGHFSYFDQHAKDEHFGPLFEQIRKLDEDLYNVLFEQHWLTAQTDRQAILNENMSTRAIHKALLESAALIAASAVQVYLLRRLFERKLGTSRV
uniref:GOLD domain-containing protein n=2 Tax=Aegilops tauschii subsp. strangulata TaxID=200361 RepID=A0A453L8Q9_AEGTS